MRYYLSTIWGIHVLVLSAAVLVIDRAARQVARHKAHTTTRAELSVAIIRGSFSFGCGPGVTLLSA